MIAEAPVAVLAGAAEILRFPQAAGMQLKRIRGQITRLPATEGSRALATVVCAEGYVAPVRNDEHTLGASFDFHSQDLAPTIAEHAGNLDLLREISPTWPSACRPTGSTPPCSKAAPPSAAPHPTTCR